MPGKKIQFDTEQVAKLAGLGLTQAQIADWFGASERTLRNRLTEDDELVAAYKRGKAIALEKVTAKLWKNIEDGDKASIFFYLKCQANWSETQIQRHEGDVPVLVVRREIEQDGDE